MLRNGKEAEAAGVQQVRREKNNLAGKMQGLINQRKKAKFQPKCSQTPLQVLRSFSLLNGEQTGENKIGSKEIIKEADEVYM